MKLSIPDEVERPLSFSGNCRFFHSCPFSVRILWWVACGILVGIEPARLPAQQAFPTTIPLVGWEASIDDGNRWQPIKVPGTIEDQWDVDFDGVSRYRARFSLRPPAGKRVLARFSAVATEATVFCNGQEVGSHLGGWTPFEVDLTQALMAGDPADEVPEQRIEIRVDEKVGHNTQGFLPIIAPHFSGIWQPVAIELRPRRDMVADSIALQPDLESGRVEVSVPVKEAAGDPGRGLRLGIRHRKVGTPNWSDWIYSSQAPSTDQRLLETAFTVADPDAWSPRHPVLYEIQLTVATITDPDQTAPAEGSPGRVVTRRFGFRHVDVDGTRIRLNGKPLVIRGLLNWGYAPPSVAPTLDEAAMRRDIEFAQARGFNLMKFCLWLPPRRYLELCDEMGMMAWVEYPAWHPDFSTDKLASLRREYREFFHYDRNHPCVVLRSLTCETGPSADLDVVRELYNLCKAEIPGAVVEDDSSWIQWNRVHDFYDDHPYGNNHTWPATLRRLQDYIAEHGAQPLVLGEAIAADTWVDPEDFDPGWLAPADTATGTSTPFHAPMFLAANDRWWERMSRRGADLEQFDRRTRNYAMQMRTYQIQQYREQVPAGGYVVSVIRDFRKAAMGLIDYRGQPKWKPEDWAFQGAVSLSLDTAGDRRAFALEPVLTIPLRQSEVPGAPAHATQLTGTLALEGREIDSRVPVAVSSTQGGTSPQLRLEFDLAGVEVEQPVRAIVKVASHDESGIRVAEARWPIWLIPTSPLQTRRVAIDDSLKLPTDVDHWLEDRKAADMTVTSRLTPGLVDRLAAGGKVVVLPDPGLAVAVNDDAGRGRFPTNDHWFLRGGPIVFPNASIPSELTPMLMELQHFDLAGPVVPEIDSMLDQIDPLLLLWDNHDRADMRTHGLVFSVPVGRGTMLVSTLNHFGSDNVAGHWLLDRMLEHLEQLPAAESERGVANLARLQSELNRQEMELHRRDWQFQPDPEVVGESKGWYAIEFDDSQWKTLQCDRHWDSQGFGDLDGWGWYRLQVPPSQLNEQESLYLNFTGVDDHYRLWVNGQYVGSDGEIETKATAFDRRTSWDISKHVRPGEPIQIAVAVYDWYGAGGIFRPVTLSTVPLSEDRPWLK